MARFSFSELLQNPVSEIIPIHPAPPENKSGNDVEQSLYEVRQKIHPRAVSGKFAYWRIALVLLTQSIFYGLPWLTWDGRQAVLLDLAARKFYIFGLVLWPQDVIYLSLLLIISAYSLFLFTAIAGRLFCGYACPQTVYTEIFLKIEQWIEGDRVARIRLDSDSWNWRKIRLRGSKHLAWAAIALWTGFTFTGYFSPIRNQWHDVITFALGPWQAFWMLFYSFATWGNAGFMREQVCKYMCPYARFQSVMVDKDTLVVTYDTTRGEPRGKRSRKEDHRAQGLGDCIDCSICVQVCPTGIDIRDGLQYECIGCGACIDSCDQVMDKLGYPRGLVRYTSENAVSKHFSFKEILHHILRPRVIIYISILFALLTIFFGSLFVRQTLRVDVIRDRGVLARYVNDGEIENVYQLQLINTSNQLVRVALGASGLEGLIVLNRQEQINPIVELPAESNKLVPIKLRIPERHATEGSNKVTIEFHPIRPDGSVDTSQLLLKESTRFFVPTSNHEHEHDD